jgi:broad specificity phosphatase PhoE
MGAAEPGLPLERRAFLFVRHGETDWNRARLCVGQADRPLTEDGRRQARRLAERMDRLGVCAIFHSPLSRAAETAAILAARLSCPAASEPGLIEACLGAKEGCREDDPQDDFIQAWLAGGEIAGAERYRDFARRVVAAANCCLSKAPPGVPMLVSHWAVHFALAQAAGVGADDIGHCVPRRFAPMDGGWTAEPLPPVTSSGPPRTP